MLSCSIDFNFIYIFKFILELGKTEIAKWFKKDMWKERVVFHEYLWGDCSRTTTDTKDPLLNPI